MSTKEQSRIISGFDIFFENRALSVCEMAYLSTSCQKSEKFLEQFSRKVATTDITN